MEARQYGRKRVCMVIKSCSSWDSVTIQLSSHSGCAHPLKGSKLRSPFVRHLQWPNPRSEIIGFFHSVSPNRGFSHTNHNQNKKAHRNGIKRPKSNRTRSLRGVSVFYLPNLSIYNSFWFRLTPRFVSFIFGLNCYGG
jgi:hypothetical protein